MDHVQVPNVITKMKIRNFEITFCAYKRLSKRECLYLLRKYIRSHKLKQLPKSGKIRIISTIGFDPELGL